MKLKLFHKEMISQFKIISDYFYTLIMKMVTLNFFNLDFIKKSKENISNLLLIMKNFHEIKKLK